MPSTPAPSLPSLSSSRHPPPQLPPSDSSSAPAASRAFTSPSPPHPAPPPPPPPQNGAPQRHEAQPGAQGDVVMDAGEAGETGGAGTRRGQGGYGPGEGFDVDEFSEPGQMGSAAGVAAAREAAAAAAAREALVLDLTASDDETDEEEVGWEVWREALEEIVGEETPADRAWREGDEQVTLPLARFRYAAAAAAVVSLKRARRHARNWRDYPESDAHEARGYAAFAIYDILADTLLALRATARDEARYERTSQHRRREQHRQTPPSPP